MIFSAFTIDRFLGNSLRSLIIRDGLPMKIAKMGKCIRGRSGADSGLGWQGKRCTKQPNSTRRGWGHASNHLALYTAFRDHETSDVYLGRTQQTEPGSSHARREVN